MPQSLIWPHLLNLPADIPWKSFRPGIEIHYLHDQKYCSSGSVAALLRYQPGATVPAHRHSGFEYILILAGSQVDHNGEHCAGTLVINPPGSHHSVASPQGCTVLIIWERSVEFL